MKLVRLAQIHNMTQRRVVDSLTLTKQVRVESSPRLLYFLNDNEAYLKLHTRFLKLQTYANFIFTEIVYKFALQILGSHINYSFV